MTRLSHLNAWRAVDAVLRTGSLAGAAEEEGVTTAAVGARIRELERRIGRPLFSRHASGLCPLPEAIRVRHRLAEALRTLASVQREVSVSPESPRIALSVTQTFAESWLPRHMASLIARIPDIDLRLHTSWDVVSLEDGGYDFAIRYMDTPGHTFGEVPLMPSGVVPVCTPDFASRYGLRPGLRTLDGIPVAHTDVPTSDPDWCDWSEWSRRTGIDLGDASLARFTLTGSGMRVAMSGMGLVLGGWSDVLHELDQGHLVMPLGRRSAVGAGFWHRLIWPAERPMGPTKRTFCRWMGDRAEADRRIMRRVFDPDP
jgi:LysR family glycine cleavage system transcriptional activator/LysR family transcriptional regulator of beta-lactamase